MLTPPIESRNNLQHAISEEDCQDNQTADHSPRRTTVHNTDTQQHQRSITPAAFVHFTNKLDISSQMNNQDNKAMQAAMTSLSQDEGLYLEHPSLMQPDLDKINEVNGPPS